MPSEAYPRILVGDDKHLEGMEESLEGAVSLSIFFSGVIYP